MIRFRTKVGLVLVVSTTLGCSASADRYASVRTEAFAGFEESTGDGDRRAVSPRGRAVFGEATELSLEAVLRLAEVRNPTLAAARASWQAAVERYPQVTAFADPTFGYAFAPGSIDSDESIYGQKIEVAQRFPWPGKLGLRGDSVLGDADAAGEGFEDARQHLRHATTEAFYAYWLTHRAIEINRTNQGLLAEFQRIAERRYGAGLASKSDALQAEVEHQHLVHRGIALERDRKVAQARLNTLLNLPPKYALPSPPVRVARPKAVAPPRELEVAALESRPELQSLEHTVTARAADVEFAHREYFPDFAVHAGYNSLWEVVDKRTIVGIAIDVPLQLGRREAAVNEAEAIRRRAQAKLDEARADTLLEVSEAYDQLVETEHVVHLYSSSILPVARESLDTARVGYEAGSNDFLTLVQSEKSLYLAELTYQEALAAYHQGRARLEFAIGRPLVSLDAVGVQP
ncbi:MAG: TolC family protein [Candidatus Binatia bacterium]|nr:TolC family protein [Candidatus Binatia bacterium]